MTAIDRRAMLGTMLGGGDGAAGIALMSGPAESALLTMSKDRAAPKETFIQEAVVVVRRRRRTCWWRRGRRICGWR